MIDPARRSCCQQTAFNSIFPCKLSDIPKLISIFEETSAATLTAGLTIGNSLAGWAAG